MTMHDLRHRNARIWLRERFSCRPSQWELTGARSRFVMAIDGRRVTVGSSGAPKRHIIAPAIRGRMALRLELLQQVHGFGGVRRMLKRDIGERA